jgi:MFS family permease
VISASAVGTMIEWYDFYIFGSLASVISPLFYPSGNDTLALIAYLSTFAVGFVVRPFGALFFGRIGDLVGRKYAFLVTLDHHGRRDRARSACCRRTPRSASAAPHRCC